MKTVCRVVAERVNDGAAPADVVTAEQLQDRVRTKEQGRRESKMAQCHDNYSTQAEPSQPEADKAEVDHKEKPQNKPAAQEQKKLSPNLGPQPV